jgi:hypothetical protein
MIRRILLLICTKGGGRMRNYNFTQALREIARRKARATYDFSGVMEVVARRKRQRIVDQRNACPICRQAFMVYPQTAQTLARLQANVWEPGIAYRGIQFQGFGRGILGGLLGGR